MTIARARLIDIHSTPYYVVVNRCVRRTYLCGDDPFSGKNYERRRQWILDNIKRKRTPLAISRLNGKHA